MSLSGNSTESTNTLAQLQQGNRYLGSAVYKSVQGTTSARYLWIDSGKKELRWSLSQHSRQNFNKLSLARIKRVLPLPDIQKLGFKIETRTKAISFVVKTQAAQDLWLNGLMIALNQESLSNSGSDTNENDQSKSPILVRKRTAQEIVLSEFNQGPRETLEIPQDSGNNEELVKQICKMFSVDQQNSSQLPEILRTFLSKLPPDSKQVEAKINMLRKRMRVFEIEKEQFVTLDHMKSEYQERIDKENDRIKHYEALLEDNEADVNRIYSELGLYKREQANLNELSSQIEYSISRRSKNNLTAREYRFEILKKGFHAYVCTLADEEIIPQVNLTPKRPFENGVYKKRIVTCSFDMKYLIWKPVSLFSTKKATLPIQDITSILIGTEDAGCFQPFVGYLYITIYTANMMLIFAVERSNWTYFEGLQDIYNYAQGLPPVPNQLNTFQEYQLAAEHLQTQLQLVNKLTNKYKTQISDSTCMVDNGFDEQYSGYLEELGNIRDLSSRVVKGVVSSSPDDFLRKERLELMERLASLEKIVEQANLDKQTKLARLQEKSQEIAVTFTQKQFYMHQNHPHTSTYNQQKCFTIQLSDIVILLFQIAYLLFILLSNVFPRINNFFQIQLNIIYRWNPWSIFPNIRRICQKLTLLLTFAAPTKNHGAPMFSSDYSSHFKFYYIGYQGESEILSIELCSEIFVFDIITLRLPLLASAY